MTTEEAQRILVACGPGEPNPADPEVAAALAQMKQDPQLARWFEEERAFDQAVANHLAAVSAPLGLKTRILANADPNAKRSKLGWAAVIVTGVAALFFVVAQILFPNRSAPKPTATLADFQEEMIGFARRGFTLELQTENLEPIQHWLAQQGDSPAALDVPAALARYKTVGCRILSFHGHKVSLICFWRDKANHDVAHLFVIDRAALPEMKTEGHPRIAKVDGWMTASWVKNGRIYTLALQGDEETIRQLLPRA